MRRILLMVFALAMFMGLSTTGAMAAGKKSDDDDKGKCTYGTTKSGKCKPKPKECTYGTTKSGKCKPKPDDDADACKYGVKADHTCMPKPEDCKYGMSKGECNPKPPECPYGKDDDGNCKPPPVVVPPPATGPCAQSDLVLLEALLKGTGGLLCLYLGDNAVNASDQTDCAGALLALPIDPLIGVCLFLPPADVGGSPSPAVGGLSSGTPLTSGGPLGGLLKQLTGLLKLV
jgi:hypothetical protein